MQTLAGGRAKRIPLEADTNANTDHDGDGKLQYDPHNPLLLITIDFRTHLLAGRDGTVTVPNDMT
ncbi:hypothetical protein [Novipirellula caenicola]|uniref:hypothetical protein n=1 Tax=Novipirellula caenicola TaxID=1536901 RepID=UPI0031E98E47